ncbi:unnamed protein product [Brachionus calyciflorus]|uniref:RNA polymerase II-associated protein 3 n=1 Tax=Brachionus calyciflorus TaxID=104777 RepID=A0A813M1J2_9BILA|nr:unnamed protein product [Brachionus calyciflorus]
MSDYEKKMIELQFQMKENQTYMHDCFEDLESWTKDIKEKEKKILEEPNSIKNSNKGLPPIRAIATTKKKKKKTKKDQVETSQKQKKLASYDYRAWDKIDVDKMCQEIDDKKTSSSEYTTDEEWEEEQRKVKAEWEKERGNQFFKDNMLNEAINCYTQAIQLDPLNAVYPGNRAMCLLKQEKYGAAEADCTLAIELDSKYAKAYHRRGTARFKLGKFEEAKKDYEMLLKLEPNSKLAQTELNKLEQLVESRNLVFPVFKKEEEKSQKPLRRILIEEINDDSIERNEIKRNLDEINQKIVLTDKDESLFSLNDKKQELEVINEKLENVDLKEIEPKPDFKKIDKPENIMKINVNKAIPEAPNNGYQFKKDWQLLNDNIESLAKYFKKISPEDYPKLFLNGLESDHLSKILVIFSEYFLSDSEIDLFKCLKYLSSVKRFQTQFMFLTSNDKKAIEKLMNHIKSLSERYQKNELEDLIKKYQF